ncbi:MAG: hypothetical protein QXX64_02515 [Nitrososphaera sp.]|uniref:Uncharacterized protein n=1 Tax=Nitrososphaera gargensis (strain Ga9.2) TaxID=1237085 RepID=K0ICY4_NITGG|nr:hypothetical protein [Candidatus Nitrososphaera gargensis]AFU59226.1 hypothetical protein Ngar_c22990 [Candidatus Nitrososphaera gargensis Ga9.2]
MYPYKLDRNPYPSSPTPTLIDAQILGGRRHKDAKAALLSCISDLHSKVSAGTATDKDFRLVTVIQDVGSGKTHLALHTKGLKEVSDSAVVSYVDLSQISPRNMHSLYSAMLAGFTDEYATRLRQAVVDYLREKAERNIGSAKKIFNYGFMDSLTGKSLADKAAQLLRNELVPNYTAITDTLGKEFSPVEIAILKLVIEGKFRADEQNVATLEDIIASLAALASLNLKFLHRLTLFQIDEFDADRESVEFVKAVINAHLPATALMLIFTPSSYDDIRRSNVSVFDRLEKANYKVDIAGSNTLEEIMDIVLEYIRHYDATKSFAEDQERDLAAKVKVIYDEFPDFRNVRSMLNIMYHATENAAKRDIATIDEQAIDDTIKNVYPGLRIRGSVMDVPISDFIKIRRNCNDISMLESGVRNAVKDLVNYAHEVGVVARPHSTDAKGNGIDVMYSDPYGTKVAVAVVINKDHAKSFEQISNTLKSTGFVDKLVILTNANTTGGTNGSTLVNIDRCKMIDLIYFSNKYKNNEMQQDDSQRAILLAKSIRLC